MELLVWCLANDYTASQWLRKHTRETPLARLSSRVEHHLSRSDSLNWGPHMLSKLRFRQFLRWYSSLSFKDRIAIFVLDPSEAINAGWLVYIVIAQTFGLYQNCNCMASIWGGRDVRAYPSLISKPVSLTCFFRDILTLNRGILILLMESEFIGDLE